MQDRWRRLVDDISENEFRGASFRDLVDLVNKEARILSNPLYGKQVMGPQIRKTDDKGKPSGHQKQVSAKVHLNVTDKVQNQLKCFFCNENHHQDECKTLMKTPENERRDFIMKRGLCFKCLRSGHRYKECRKKKKVLSHL